MCHRSPALVVNAAVAKHLEVLRLMLFGGLRLVEGVTHADTLEGVLLDAVHRLRLRQAGDFKDGWGHVNDVGELRADLALGFDALGPVDDRAVARAAPVGGNLFGPLVRRVHRERPAHGVMIVGLRPAEFIHPLGQVLGRLHGLQAVEVAHLVVATVDRTLGGGAVIADDVVDERVVEEVQLLQHLNDAPDVVVGVFHVTRIDLHLSGQHGPECFRRRVPSRDFFIAGGELAVGWNDAELFLSGKGFLAQLVVALVELALVFISPFLGHVMRRVGGAGGKVNEERLVGRERLLLPDPFEGLVGHVGHEMVTLLGRLLVLHRRGAFEERRIPLIRLATDEAVEVLEAAAARGPGVEGAGRTGLPDRDFVALAELRGGVAIQFQRLRQRRHGVGPHRAVARRAGGNLGDSAHAGGVVVTPGEQRLPRWRTQGGGVETVVLQAARSQLLQGRRLAGTAKGAGRTEAGVVNEHDQDIGRTLGRAQLLDRGIFRVRAFCVVVDVALPNGVRHGQMRPVFEFGRVG